MAGLKITLAGQDITTTADEMSLKITDVLGQGPGTGASGSGRAATAEFVTTLGPAATAIGAGTPIDTPKLVRMGEVQMWDRFGNMIFGGYAAKLTDQTERTRVYTKIECYDYWQHLDRIIIPQAGYSGVSDIVIINSLLTKYAPWIDRSRLPPNGIYTFTVKNYKGVSLQKALSQITDITGYQIWISPDKKIHYESPTQAQTAPFALSDKPDFRHSFQFGIEEYDTDDTAAINRVTFYGGKKPTNDYTQDLSTQVNGSNKTFVLAYYPRKASSGKYVLTVNGTQQAIGYTMGTTTADKLKSQGGTADVLLNADAHTYTFDVAPPSGATVLATYRYEYPMVIQLTDQSSFQYFGAWYDGLISDDTIFDSAVAVGRCRTLLAEQSRGLITIKLHCYKPGLQSGQLLRIDNDIHGIHGSYNIQEVDTVPLGNGNFRYDVTLGAWNYNLVDAVMQTMTASQRAGIITTNSDTNGQDATGVNVQQMLHTPKTTTVYTKTTKTPGQFYARSTPVGDGHDAYPGLFSVTS